jgi:hypothetical protein
MSKTYFATDGSYGDGDYILVTDTDNWTPEDWATIEEASDLERPDVAEKLARKNGAKRWEVWYRDYETGEQLPLGYAPLFHSKAEAEEYLDKHGDWEFPVWVDEVDFCTDCWEAVGNSVTEQVNGYTKCHSCLVHPVGR